MVRLRVQRDHDAGEHREQRADEDGEEIIDAGAPSPQPIQSLHVKRERHEDRDDRQRHQVLREGRLRFRDRHELGKRAAEPDEVGEREGEDRRHGVGHQETHDEQAVVAS